MPSVKTFAQQVCDFHFSMNPKWKLPKGVELINPFTNAPTKEIFESFYLKYFNDNNSRHFLFGINPGRFGAGITGVPFTDPKILEEKCDITNSFQKKNELSAIFVYEFIDALGGPRSFYENFYITSVCPLGFIKNGKNYNYYDDNLLYESVKPIIINNIETQIKFGCHREVAFCMGMGKNMKYLKKINDEHGFFEKLIPLPHPRWVMQYKLKSKAEHLNKYVMKLDSAMDKHN